MIVSNDVWRISADPLGSGGGETESGEEGIEERRNGWMVGGCEWVGGKCVVVAAVAATVNILDIVEIKTLFFLIFCGLEGRSGGDSGMTQSSVFH